MLEDQNSEITKTQLKKGNGLHFRILVWNQFCNIEQLLYF